MSDYPAGKHGQQGQADPAELVQRMLTSVVQHSDQIPHDQTGEVERAMGQVHQTFVDVSGLTGRELRRQRGELTTVQEPGDTRLSDLALQQAQDILYLIESGPNKETNQFRQTCVSAIQPIQHMLRAAGQQAPAQAEQYITAQAGDQGQRERRPGSGPI